MTPNRREVVVGASAMFGAVALGQPTGARFTPEQFGASGDGATNDSPAFARLAAAVQANGGGTIALRRTTYLVGGQTRIAGADYAWDPSPLIELRDLKQPIVIQGNGATLRCRSGLLYGTFNPATGRPSRHPQPHYGHGEIASPYRWMICVRDCTGSVEIRDITLDGNLDGMIIGGPWGDTGHQLPASGLGLYNNSGPERLTNVRCVRHALDGIIIDGISGPRTAPSIFTDVHCQGNGRQGCSIVGGNGYQFAGCTFEGTGTGKLMSAPGAGVDLEAEGGKRVRNIRFDRCRFAHNAGTGLLAAEGDVADVAAFDCTFIGTHSWGAWPNKPRMKFERCTFAGAITNAFGSGNEAATRFTHCRFVDDPAVADGRRVYAGDNGSRPIAVLPYGAGAQFAACTFLLTHDCVLPWSVGVTYRDCSMRQVSREMAYPRGTYVGTNTIVGQADLNYSRIVGRLTLNGRLLTQADLLG